MNNTTKKTPCQPQSVHSLGMLIAENVTLPQLLDFRLRTQEWDFTQRRLVVSCRRFGTAVGGGEILTAMLVKIHLGHLALSTVQFTFIFRANSPR
jgi:hypothetical protein